MRKCLLLISCCWFTILHAQNIDITEFSQNQALKDTLSTSVDSSERILSNYPQISETYQIPAFSLYGQYWDVEHLRSKILEIPFSENRLMLLLVQESNNPFSIPCAYNEVVCPFGWTKKGEFHPGVDLSVEFQTLVKSCFDGVVRMAKHYGDYELVVVIRHYNGLETVYAHLDKLCVKPGQIVHAGDVIGQAGKSGRTKECLLHFETRFMNEYFDPTLIIDFDEEDLIKNTVVLTNDDFGSIPLDSLDSKNSVLPKPKATPSPKVIPTDTKEANAISTNENIEYHIVQKGETLYRIATQYHISVERILELNNLSDPNKISEGQKLRIL